MGLQRGSCGLRIWPHRALSGSFLMGLWTMVLNLRSLSLACGPGFGLWTTVLGLWKWFWLVDRGFRFVDFESDRCGPRTWLREALPTLVLTLLSGPWTLTFGLWTLVWGCGPWILLVDHGFGLVDLGVGLWTMGFGLWTMVLELVELRLWLMDLDLVVDNGLGFVEMALSCGPSILVCGL